jgi:hypothetical protein
MSPAKNVILEVLRASIFDVVSFRVVFLDSLSNVDGLAVKICEPSVHHGISAYIINDINRAKKTKVEAN